MQLSPHALVVLASLAAAAGCVPPTARSSASFLGPDASTVVVRRAPADAAADLVHLLASRGYTLFDQQQQRDEVLTLRFHGDRRRFAGGRPTRVIGSVYYAFVAPHADGYAAITLIGRPTLDGVELCTPDLRLADTGCVQRHVGSADAQQLAGRAEAELVLSVFSELRSRGVVDDSVAPAYKLLLARDLCYAEREQQLARARALPDVRARAHAYARLPSCD